MGADYTARLSSPSHCEFQAICEAAQSAPWGLAVLCVKRVLGHLLLLANLPLERRNCDGCVNFMHDGSPVFDAVLPSIHHYWMQERPRSCYVFH